MITISLCMIVKNEENTLGRCLDSVKDIVDEIIIVDTSSTDNTKEVAKKFTTNIFDFEWIDDFSAARNFSFSKATKDYQFWLDADDVLLEDDRIKLKNLKTTLNPDIDVVMMKYNIGCDDAGNPQVTFYRERLLKRSKNFLWNNIVHETVGFGGNIINTDISVTHRKERSSKDRNLKILEKYVSQNNELDQRTLFYYARELYFNGRFDEAIDYFNKFLDTINGLPANYIDACIDMSNCHLFKSDRQNAIKALVRYFEHDIPRAEICCQLGYIYKSSNEYSKAIAWFDTATKIKKPEITWGSVKHDCWDYIPYMEMCSCYYRMGKIKEAIECNNKVCECKPNDPSGQYNKVFLQGIVDNIKNISM